MVGKTIFFFGRLAPDLSLPYVAVCLPPPCSRLVFWCPVAQLAMCNCRYTRSGPIPKLNLSVLGIISNTVPDSDNKVFIGGLPYNLTEDQVRTVAACMGQQAFPRD